MSNPNPTTPTPLPSQWDSGVIRQIAYAALGLLATVAADFFGVTRELIEEKGGRLIEAVVTLLIVAVPLYLAYRARKYKPTPPITMEAVHATAIREVAISTASPAQKETAARSPWIVGLIAVLMTVAVVGVIPGCAGTKAAYSTAKASESSLADTAYVVAEHYAAIVKEAADLAQSPSTPENVKEALKGADLAAKPYILELRSVTQKYLAVKNAATQAELQAAVNDAVLELAKFINAVKAARGRA